MIILSYFWHGVWVVRFHVGDNYVLELAWDYFENEDVDVAGVGFGNFQRSLGAEVANFHYIHSIDVNLQ